MLSEKDQTETVIFQRMADVGWSVEGFMAVVKAIDDGEYEISTHEVENILGRPATSFEQTAIWLRDQHAKRNQ